MVREKPKIIIVLIFLSFVYSMNSQTTISQDYYARFKHLTVADGLPASHITTLLQDNNLFIWIGTTKGLTRYDGHTFRKFFHHSNDSTSIPNVCSMYFPKNRKISIISKATKEAFSDSILADFCFKSKRIGTEPKISITAIKTKPEFIISNKFNFIIILF